MAYKVRRTRRGRGGTKATMDTWRVSSFDAAMQKANQVLRYAWEVSIQHPNGKWTHHRREDTRVSA